MRIARTLFALFLLSSLCFSCTKQDLTEDENLINDAEIVAIDKNPLPPIPPSGD